MDAFDLWPGDDELADFRAVMERFEATNWKLAMRVVSSFARKLGVDDDFFTARHDPTRPEYRSTLRLLHYLPVDAADLAPGIWRAGAHTDFDCLNPRPTSDRVVAPLGAHDGACRAVPRGHRSDRSATNARVCKQARMNL